MSILPQQIAKESIMNSNELMTKINDNKEEFLSNMIDDPNSEHDVPRPIVDIHIQDTPQTITKSLKLVELNKLCFLCKEVVEDKCIELTPDEKICSDCIIQTLIRKLDDYPKSNLKVLNDQSVFSIQGKNNIIPLSFTECFKKLSHNKRSEFRQKIANRKKALVQEVSQKCMICKSLLQKVDNNVITIEIDQSYNYYQHLFPEINYCTKDHFVCENCYKKWITFTKKNAFNDSIVLKCSLCKVEHKCSNKTNNVCIII